MYKFERYRQLGLADFNQSAGLKMNLENCWIKKATDIPRETIEEKHTGFFSSKTGMPAKSLCMACKITTMIYWWLNEQKKGLVTVENFC